MNTYLAWKGWQDREFGQLVHEDANYFSNELRKCGFPSMKGLVVGELGFGNGNFAAWVRSQGGHWLGKEADPDLLDRAREAGYQAIGDGCAWVQSEAIDELAVLVAFDVLEHLDIAGIRSFLAEARTVLRPGGALVFRVPSGDSPFSGAIYYGDLTHRTLLGSLAVRQLAFETGFEVLQIRPPTLPLRGLGTIRVIRRAVLWCLQKFVYGFLSRFILGAKGLVFSPNMVVVLRKPGVQD